MTFIALGINHRTAPVAVRERLAFAPEAQADALRGLCERTGSQEAAILSTCNRSELYLAQEGLSHERVLDWLAEYHHLNAAELHTWLYVHSDADAVRHMMRVACGLDSMVLGEPQILGQLKDAYGVAQAAGTVGPLLGRLFQAAFGTAKSIRTDTAIGANPVSVAFAAVSLARQIFSHLGRTQALLIGAGDTIERVARHLHEQGVSRIFVANRTLERAEQLAAPLGAQALTLGALADCLPHSDIVISSTASPLPVLGKGVVERALKQRRHKPIFMVDLAVPRDIEPEVGELDDVYLYTVDDLREVVDDSLKSRQEAARLAEQLVLDNVDAFLRQLRALAAVDVVTRYRQRMESLRDVEMDKALRLLRKGNPPEAVLEQLARALTSKLMHEPSVQMKRLSAEGRLEALSLAEELFALDSSAPFQDKT